MPLIVKNCAEKSLVTQQTGSGSWSNVQGTTDPKHVMASDEADVPLQKAKKQRSEEETEKRFLERVTQKAKKNEEQRERERE